MGEIKFIVGLTMAVLFTIAVTTYAFGFAGDNNAEIRLENEGEFVVANEERIGNLTTFVIADVNSSSEAFYESTIEAGDETMGGGGAFKIGLGSLYSTTKSTLSLTKKYVFGGSSAFGLFLTAISGLLIYIGFRYVYKTWVGKNPD